MSKKNSFKKQKSTEKFIESGVNIHDKLLEILELIEQKKALEIELDQMLNGDEIVLTSLLELKNKIDQITVDLNKKGSKLESDMSTYMSDYSVLNKQ